MAEQTTSNGYELTLTRVFDVPRETLFKAWTTPELIRKWWAPRPFTTPEVEIDLRPGGAFNTLMRDADGNPYPNNGVFLEIVENEKIVFTDAFAPGWVPAGKPFMTAIVTFEDAGNGKTRYTARALHWREEDRKTHEEMGFHEGWGQVADQLAEIVADL